MNKVDTQYPMKGFQSINQIKSTYGGRLSTTTDIVASVKDSINLILSTKVGERAGMPDYGTRLSQAIFDMNDPATVMVIQDEVFRAIESYEPRADIKDVIIESNPDGYIVNVEVIYDIRDLGQEYMLDKIK